MQDDAYYVSIIGKIAMAVSKNLPLRSEVPGTVADGRFSARLDECPPTTHGGI
jgi:hypothetical protein